MYTQQRRADINRPALPTRSNWSPEQAAGYEAGRAESRRDGLALYFGETFWLDPNAAEAVPVIPPGYAAVSDFYHAGWYAEQKAMWDEKESLAPPRPDGVESARRAYEYGWANEDRRQRGVPLPVEGPRWPDATFDYWYPVGQQDRQRNLPSQFQSRWDAQGPNVSGLRDPPDVLAEFVEPPRPRLPPVTAAPPRPPLTTDAAPPPRVTAPAASGSGWVLGLAAGLAAGAALTLAARGPKRRGGGTTVV